VAAETAHKTGEEGVVEIKEWLEATTRFAFTFTVYDNAGKCSLRCLDGSRKTFDLEGNTVPVGDEAPRPVSVEAKKYSQAGTQGPDFRRFLAVAYSHTALEMSEIGDPEREFLWVTFHPFSLGDWSRLHDLDYLKECVEEHKDLLGEHEIDLEILAKVASRTKLMVVGQRQVDLRLSAVELRVIQVALEKERS
jgi:hypothetical protein